VKKPKVIVNARITELKNMGEKNDIQGKEGT
jgi:hypothetical protein